MPDFSTATSLPDITVTAPPLATSVFSPGITAAGITGNNPITSSGVAATIAASASSVSQLGQYEYLTERPKYYFSMAIGDYSRQDIFTVTPILSTGDVIILPLPEKLVDRHSIGFETTPLGAFLGTAVNEYLKGVKSASDLLTSGMNIAAASASSIIQQTNIGNVASAVGYSPNQFLTVTMKGPSYKRFQFQWNLSPRNARESQKLNLIINKLHNSAAPSLTAANLVFKFPKIFQIAFVPNPQYLFKFKPAVLEDIQIDYTGAGAPNFFRMMDSSGMTAPSNLLVTLQFLELEFWLAGNWQDNNKATDTHQQNPDTIGNPIQAVINALNPVTPAQ